MADITISDPLERLFPEAEDRLWWQCIGRVTAADTGDSVAEYQHTAIGRTLRLDDSGRVYGQDAEGVVRVFGRGGALALSIALNAVFDGMDAHRPSRVVIPGRT